MDSKHLTATLLAALALTGCSVAPTSVSLEHMTFEVAAGANVSKYMAWSRGLDGGFAGPADTVRFTARYEISRSAFCALSHISHLSAGWPVNDKSEDWLDIAECGVRFGARARQ